jgi:hypothetical protein
MKIRQLLPVIFIFFGINSAAESPDKSHGFSVGYEIGSIANGLALGARVASPSFFHNIFRATAKANLGWVQNVVPTGENEATWLRYGLFRLGIQGGVFVQDLPIRIMSSAEVALVVPQSKISSKNLIFGLAGNMDIEFFMDPMRSHAMVLSMGGIGLIPPTADNLPGKPSFANGFLASFGYRFYL